MQRTLWLLCLVAVLTATEASAYPEAPAVFCENYSQSPFCQPAVPKCILCHQDTPPAHNPFGDALRQELLPGQSRPLTAAQFSQALPAALERSGSLDSDGDGQSNLIEIEQGTYPGDADSKSSERVCDESGEKDGWQFCQYDPNYVFKKIYLDFCGRSPDYPTYQAFIDTQDKMGALHRVLDYCLDSSFWLGQDGQLWQMAHTKVKPLQGLGDYLDDYALFVYLSHDDRDVRELLTADYYVVRDEGSLRYQITYLAEETRTQRLRREYRAGMLTTWWALVNGVMFSSLPRNAAAHAYREYLGLDISQLQGLYPVAEEPQDYDRAGVQEAECRRCHSTLDALAYPFKNYHGLTSDFGTYSTSRIETYFSYLGPQVLQMPEAGSVLGQPVDNLRQWGQVAADSQAFAAKIVLDYWILLVGKPPENYQKDEFKLLWQGLMSVDNYRVEAMLHRLIETNAYGEP